MQRYAAGWKDDAAIHPENLQRIGHTLGKLQLGRLTNRMAAGASKIDLEVIQLLNMVSRDVEFHMRKS